MDKYAKGEETNYINFNIIVNGNNMETVNNIAKIIQKTGSFLLY